VGTGFLVATRLVVACAHVLADTREHLPTMITGIFFTDEPAFVADSRTNPALHEI